MILLLCVCWSVCFNNLRVKLYKLLEGTGLVLGEEAVDKMFEVILIQKLFLTLFNTAE